MKRKIQKPIGRPDSNQGGPPADARFKLNWKATADTEVAETRDRALLLTSPQFVQDLHADGVLGLQTVLQHGATFGRWLTPKSWCPSGTQATMNIDLRGRIVHFLPDRYQNLAREAEANRAPGLTEQVVHLAVAQAHINQVLDTAVAVLTRYLVLLRMGPAGMGRKGSGKSLDPSSVRLIGYSYAPRLLALGTTRLLDAPSGRLGGSGGMDQSASQELSYLAHIVPKDIDSLGDSEKHGVLRESDRMHILFERGCWSDVPALVKPLTSVSEVAGAEKASAEERGRAENPHLPLPDDYVSEMGSRTLWVIQDLAPNLLKIAEEMVVIWRRTETPGIKRTTVRDHRRAQLSDFLLGFEWCDAEGKVIYTPPFPLRLSGSGKRENPNQINTSDGEQENEFEARDSMAELAWPPRQFASIVGLMRNLQMAHLFVVAMSTGARKSETLDLRRDCISYSRDGTPYANGKTYKLIQRHDGELRDWLLPDLAVQAIEQQTRLVGFTDIIGRATPMEVADNASTRPQGPTHLWMQISSNGSGDPSIPLLNLNTALTGYAMFLGMETQPGGQTMRSHRFRKTLARLVALALTQAPKILMDVFGHKTIEMTLYYILTDRALQIEIEGICRELRVMRAKDVVETMVANEEKSLEGLPLGGYGGPAALMAQRSIEVHKAGLHRRGEQWGANSAVELAEILTLQGKAWELVRPGVICTKFPGTESGPCNKSKGRPEPSRCQSHCNHRLEEAFLREDVDRSICDAVEAYNDAGTKGDELVQALWAGQIRSNIVRFADLRMKWMLDPTVLSVVDSTREALA